MSLDLFARHVFTSRYLNYRHATQSVSAHAERSHDFDAVAKYTARRANLDPCLFSVTF